MYTSKYFAALAVASILLAPVSLKAADETPVSASSSDSFNPKINAWAEGTILSLDADGKFSIRGVQRPYQTEYAKMLKDIHDKTMKLSGAERDKKEAEIRASYAASLDKTRMKDSSKQSDFTFRVNSKEGSVNFFDESNYYNKNDVGTPSSKLTDTQRATILSFKDLHVGDFVVVGYANGVLNNDAFVIIKGKKMDGTLGARHAEASKDIGSPAPVGTPAPVKEKSGLDPSTEKMRQIRRMLTEEKNLSTAAKNVQLKVTEDGKAHVSGTVRSEEEKRLVEEHAGHVVGKDNVVSGLDVKPAK